jgi:formylglycine-generating enzyme required for sulfatase activity
VQLTLCWCPAGKFLMGSPLGEAGRNEDERQHAVTLSRGFWMAKTETTQVQWEAVMLGNPSRYRGKRLPVDSVTWDQAKAFAAACTGRMQRDGKLPSGWEFRLPSEAQWEYACRAGTTTAYCGGDLEVALMWVGWYEANAVRRPSKLASWLPSLPVIGDWISGNGPSGEPKRAGEKEANGFGLQDMHGNVWEWCEDMYGDYGEGGAVDPVGAGAGRHQVVRGGAWIIPASGCRSAYRYRWGAGAHHWSLGFRVCLVPVPAADPLGGE